MFFSQHAIFRKVTGRICELGQTTFAGVLLEDTSSLMILTEIAKKRPLMEQLSGVNLTVLLF